MSAWRIIRMHMSEALFRKSNLLMISPPFVQNRIGIILGLSPQNVNEIFCSSPGRLRFRSTGLLSGGPHVPCLPSPRVSPMFRSRSAGLGDDAYTPSVYTGHSSYVWVHVVLNNISNSFLELKILGLKASRLIADFEDEKKVLIPSFENFDNVNSEL